MPSIISSLVRPGAVTLTGVTILAVGLGPAAAAEAWFASPVLSAIDNGAGPGPAPRGSVAVDVDSDGDPDIVSVAGFGQSEVLVSLNDGTGRFGAGESIAGTAGTQGLDTGDLDGDGDADLVLMTTSEASILLGDGAAGFVESGSYPLSLGGQVQPLMADVDADGDLDVLAPSFTAIQTLRNGGDATFAAGPTTQVQGAAVLSSVAIAQLDGDGRADLFAVDGFSGTTFALRGTGGGAFSVSGRLYGTGVVPEDVVAIDLDGDGFDDAATVGSFSFSLSTGLTDGRGRFRSSLPATVAYAGPGPTSAVVADLDGDGRQDLVVSSLANPSQGTLSVFAGTGSGTLREQGTYATEAFPQNPMPADYDGDGDLDLGTVSPGSLAVLANTTS